MISKGSKKFEIQISSTIIEAEKMDVLNENKFWRKAIEKELANIGISFKLLDTEADRKLNPRK